MTPDEAVALRRRVERDRDEALDLAVRAGDDVQRELALDQVDRCEQRLDRLDRLDAREEGPYAEGQPWSFFRDLAARVAPFPARGAGSPLDGQRRLAEHEAIAERPAGRVDEAARRTLAGDGYILDGVNRRAVSTVAGSGGAFSPPDRLSQKRRRSA